MKLFNKIRYFFLILISFLNLNVNGKVIKELNKLGEANCPHGWTSNIENTRCFKLMLFDKPRTFSHGFKICNELGGTEVFTKKRNGMRESNEYPVTLATVYKNTDDEAIKKVLEKHIFDPRTRNGCFVGLRKYAFFKYPPGWYWIDSSHPVSIKDSEINWSSSYNSNWLVKFKFPFEKCGFYDSGGLGRRPCWLIDSELSCAICGTVAYDSGGLNPIKYFELIKQVDDIMNKEPKLDLPIYSNLNCTDSWGNNPSIELCKNVSNILDSAWSSYKNSIHYPNINLNWKETTDSKNEVNSFLYDDTKYKQKKTFFWDQDTDSVPPLSEEIKLQGLIAQPKYYIIEKDHLKNENNTSEDLVYAQSSNSIKDILLPVTKTFTESMIYANSKKTARNDIEKVFVNNENNTNYTIENSNKGNLTNNITSNVKAIVSNTTTVTNTTTSTISTTSISTTNTSTSTSTSTSTTTTTTTTNNNNNNNNNRGTTMRDTTKAVKTTTKTAIETNKEIIDTSKKSYKTRYTTENVRTNSFVKRNNNSNNSEIKRKYEKEIDSSLSGFGAGESLIQGEENQENYQDNQDYNLSIRAIDDLTEVSPMNKSIEANLDIITENKNMSMIIGLLLSGILLLGLILVCLIIFIKKKNDKNNSDSTIDKNSSKKESLFELKLASIKPILARKDSKILPMNQQTSNCENNLAQSEKSIVSVEDTTFSPEYMNQADNSQEIKPSSCYIAQSQANTLQLHSGKGITVNYDTRAQIQRNNLVKSPKYHEFYYSEANVKSKDY